MLLEVKNLTKNFGRLRAVDGVSFCIERGRTLGIVGESGSGKSTLAKLILRLLESDGGDIYFDGRPITRLSEKELKMFRREVQIVFQEPFLSLDPRMRVAKILEEPFRIQERMEGAEARIDELLRSVELDERFLPRFPHELSGGECQRIAIARALATDPRLLVCDEPVSSLDVFVRAQILNLLLKLQTERALSLIFISHDLSVARHMSDELLVMKAGHVCEAGPREQVFQNPQDTYTKSLLRDFRTSYKI